MQVRSQVRRYRDELINGQVETDDLPAGKRTGQNGRPGEVQTGAKVQEGGQ